MSFEEAGMELEEFVEVAECIPLFEKVEVETSLHNMEKAVHNSQSPEQHLGKTKILFKYIGIILLSICNI